MIADSHYSLESLERRWQLEKTPQVGLRLAEEHRRRGNLASSIEVLAAGLEVYPTHTASRVALSRDLVDGDRFKEAVPHLEQIVALDPTHLVANKLLVGAYAGVGRVDDARDKLAIYEMMGEGDKDIERLHALLEVADRKGPVAEEKPAAEQPPTGLTESTVAFAGEEGVDGAAVFRQGLRVPHSPEAPLAPVPDRTPIESRQDSVAPVDEPKGAAPAMSEPFGEPVEPVSTAEATARASGAVSVRAQDDEPFGPAVFDEAFDYWKDVADEGIFAFEATEGRVSPTFEERGGPVSGPLGLSEPPDSASEARDRAEIGESSATLGALYLEQGHTEEAVEVFEEVLTREPENEAARLGLEGTGVSPMSDVPTLPAAPVARIEDPAEESRQDAALSLVERKKLALVAYLGQIRQAAEAGI